MKKVITKVIAAVFVVVFCFSAAVVSGAKVAVTSTSVSATTASTPSTASTPTTPSTASTPSTPATPSTGSVPEDSGDNGQVSILQKIVAKLCVWLGFFDFSAVVDWFKSLTKISIGL